MTSGKLEQARALAEKHTGKASRIILRLVQEIETLNKVLRRRLRRGVQPVGVLEAWPYHPYFGVPFHEIPEEYLCEWLKGRSREGLRFDINQGIIAERDLKLFDLITKLSTPVKPDEKPLPDEINKDQDPLPETEGEI